MILPNKTLGRTDLPVSRLGLGTAEIGFAYGIGPRTLPSESEAIYFLQQAVDFGITFFDTARFYQEAESRIGKSGILNKSGVIVATKCANFLEKKEILTDNQIEERVREEVETSLKMLRVDHLTLLQLHGASENEMTGLLPSILTALKKEGKVKFIGVSTRGEDAPLLALKAGIFDVIQVAYSVLDQRMASTVLPQAEKNKIGVINRSVLLKGSLTPAVKHLPDELLLLKQNSEKALKIAQKLDLSLPELAIRFTLNNSAISTSLIGTNKIGNLKEAIRAVSAGPLPSDIISQLSRLAINDPLQVDPAKWPKLQ